MEGSFQASGILPNLQQSINSGIIEHDIITIPMGGVHNDLPLVSRTQQFNLAKIRGIELGGGNQFPQMLEDRSFRGSRVRFAEKLEVSADKSGQQSFRGSSVGQTILMNHINPQELRELPIVRLDSQEMRIPMNVQNSFNHHQHPNNISRSPMASPRQSHVSIRENQQLTQTVRSNLNQTNLKSSQYSRTSGLPPPAQGYTGIAANLQQLNAPHLINHTSAKTMNQSYHLEHPILSQKPSVTYPQQNISERTVVNMQQSTSHAGNISSNPIQVMSNRGSQVSQQLSHHSRIQQTTQTQNLYANSPRISNVSNTSHRLKDEIIQKQIVQGLILNSRHSNTPAPTLLDTRKSNLSSHRQPQHQPQQQEALINNIIASGAVGRLTESHVEGHNQTQQNISQIIARGVQNNFRNSHVSNTNMNLTSSKAPSARFQDPRKSNVSNAIPQVLAEAMYNNIQRSQVSQRNNLEGTPRGSFAGNNIMNSTYVPQPHNETNLMRQSQMSQNAMTNQNQLRTSNVISHTLAGSVAKSIDQAQRSLRQSHIQTQPIVQSTHQTFANSQHMQGSQHQTSRISQVSNRAYNMIITPASEISNSRKESMNLGTGQGYQLVQPIVQLTTSRISPISFQKSQIQENIQGAIVKTTTIQQVISPEITHTINFIREIKTLLGLSEAQGLEEARQALYRLRQQSSQEIDILKNQIFQRQQQKISDNQTYLQTLCKFQFNVKALEQVQQALQQKKYQQQMLINENNKARQAHNYDLMELNKMRHNLQQIISQREQSSIRHRNESEKQFYMAKELEAQAISLNNHLQEERSINQRNMSEFNLHIHQLQNQIRKLEDYQIYSNSEISNFKCQIGDLLRERQLLQNEIVNKNIMSQQKDVGIQEARVKIGSLNERISILMDQLQKSQSFASELEKLKVCHKQVLFEFSQKQEHYVRESQIQRTRIMELQRQLSEFQRFRVINRDQLRQIGELQHIIRTNSEDLGMQEARYHTQISNLRAEVEMRTAQIHKLSSLVNEVPIQFLAEFENLKSQYNVLSNEVNLQKRLRMEEREGIQRQSHMKLGALKVEYQSKLTNLNKRFQETQRANDAKVIEENGRFSSLVQDHQRVVECWESRYNKQAQDLHQKNIQLSSIVCNSERVGSTAQEFRRANLQMQLRVKQQQMEKKRLRESLQMLKIREMELQKSYREKCQQLEMFKIRRNQEHLNEIARREKEFQYQRNVLSAQYHDSQERVNSLNSQYQRAMDQLGLQRKKYYEVSSNIRTEVVDNPALAFELKQKNEFIGLLNSELQEARHKLRVADEQWRDLEGENRRLRAGLETEKIEFNKINYELKCQISDLNRRLQSQSSELKLKINSTAYIPTAPSLDYISSLKLIEHIEPGLVSRIPTSQRLLPQVPYSIDKTATFQSHTQTLSQRVQNMSTPSKLRPGNVVHVQVSPLSAVTNETQSRCITAQTTISAAPTSRIVQFPPSHPLNGSRTKFTTSAVTITPPKIIKTQTGTIKTQNIITNINPPIVTQIVQNKNLQRLHSPQMNYNNRLRGRVQPEIQVGKIEMRSNKQSTRIQQAVKGVVETHIGPTNSKFINNSRSNSREKSPHRPPLNPHMSQVRISQVTNTQIKNIPIISTLAPGISPLPSQTSIQELQLRSLTRVQSNPSITVVNRQEVPSITSINNLIVEKQASRQQSLRTSVVTTNLPTIPAIGLGGGVETLQSFVSQGDYGMTVMQKDDLDRRNCC